MNKNILIPNHCSRSPEWEQDPLKILVNSGQSAEQIIDTLVGLLKISGYTDTEISLGCLKWVV